MQTHMNADYTYKKVEKTKYKAYRKAFQICLFVLKNKPNDCKPERK